MYAVPLPLDGKDDDPLRLPLPREILAGPSSQDERGLKIIRREAVSMINDLRRNWAIFAALPRVPVQDPFQLLPDDYFLWAQSFQMDVRFDVVEKHQPLCVLVANMNLCSRLTGGELSQVSIISSMVRNMKFYETSEQVLAYIYLH